MPRRNFWNQSGTPKCSRNKTSYTHLADTEHDIGSKRLQPLPSLFDLLIRPSIETAFELSAEETATLQQAD
jgi:hypothetical protein